MDKKNKKSNACLPALSRLVALSCQIYNIIDNKKAKKNPGKRSPILCKEGKIITIKDKRNKYLDGFLPYFEFANLKSNQIKNGSKAIKVNLREKRQIENVRNRGANEKQSDANQRLLWFSVNSPVSIKKPNVEISERDKLCTIRYWWIDKPVIVHIVVANIGAPKGLVPGKRPYNERMCSAQKISPLEIMESTTDM